MPENEALNSIDRIAPAIVQIAEAMSKLEPKLKGVSEDTSRASRVAKELKEAYSKAAEEVSQMGAESEETAKKIRNLRKEQDNLSKGADYIDKKYGSLTKSTNNLSSSYAKLRGTTASFLSTLGVTTVSVNRAKDMMLSYNQSLYDFSRVTQVSGRGLKDLDAAFKIVGQSTTLSKEQFASFAATVARSATGIAPSATQLAKFAVNIQEAFGPDIKKTEQVAKSFLDIMAKYPAQFALLNSVMEQAQSNKGLDELGKKQRALLLDMGRMQGMSVEQMRDVAMATTKATQEQENLIKSNKATAKVAQKTDDALLKAAKGMEGAFTYAANATQEILDKLEQMPGAIMAITAAIAAMNLTGGITGAIGMGGAGGGNILGKLGGLKGTLGKILGKEAAEEASKGAAKGLLKTAGSNILKGLKVGGITTAVFAAYDYFGEKEKAAQKGLSKSTGHKAGLAKAGWGAGGALAGAAIGSAILPGVGTVIGGIAGGVLGGMKGQSSSDKIMAEAEEKITEEKARQEEIEKKQQDNLLSIQMSLIEQQKNLEVALETQKQIQQSLTEQLDLYMQMGSLGGIQEAVQGYLESLEKAKQEQTKFFQDTLSSSGELAQALQSIDVDMTDVFKNAGFNQSEIKNATLDQMANDVLPAVIAELEKQAPKIKIEADVERKKKELDDYKMLRAQNPEDFDKNVEQVAKLEELQKAYNAAVATSQGYEMKIAEMKKKQVEAQKLMAEAAKAEATRYQKQFEALENYNSSLERRLEIEKELMSAAQFGMGASVQMMQKQVDLAYEMMNAAKKEQEATEANIRSKMKLKGVDAERILNAKSYAEVEQITSQVFGKNTQAAMEINNAWKARNELAIKSMEYQKKIYDLTKEMREGYLDAIREMSVGAGEFEKIIGTQEMGVTQLMGVVDNATTKVDENGNKIKGQLNTMKTGGMQTQEQTAAGIGMDYAGQFTVGGATFQSGAQTDAANARIYGYKDSVDKAKQQMMNGKVGTGNTGEQGESSMNALRESLPIVSASGGDAMRVVVSNTKDVAGAFDGFNPAVVNSNGRTGDFGTNEKQKPEEVTAFSMLMSRFGVASTIGNPGPFATTSGPMPNFQDVQNRMNISQSSHRDQMSKTLAELDDVFSSLGLDEEASAKASSAVAWSDAILNMGDKNASWMDNESYIKELEKIAKLIPKGSEQEKKIAEIMGKISSENQRYYADFENYKNVVRSSTKGATDIYDTGAGSRYIWGLTGLGRSGNIDEQYGGNAPVPPKDIPQQQQEQQEEQEKKEGQEKKEDAAKKEQDRFAKAQTEMSKNKNYDALMKIGGADTAEEFVKTLKGEADVISDGFSGKNEAIRRMLREKIKKKDDKWLGSLMEQLRTGGETSDAVNAAIGELPKEEQEQLKLGILGVSAGSEDNSIRYRTDELYKSMFKNGISDNNRQKAVETLSGTYSGVEPGFWSKTGASLLGMSVDPSDAVGLANYGDKGLNRDVKIQTFVDDYIKARDDREKRQAVEAGLGKFKGKDRDAFLDRIAEEQSKGGTEIETVEQADARAERLAFDGDGWTQFGAGLKGKELDELKAAHRRRLKTKEKPPLGTMGPIDSTKPFDGYGAYLGSVPLLAGAGMAFGQQGTLQEEVVDPAIATIREREENTFKPKEYVPLTNDGKGYVLSEKLGGWLPEGSETIKQEEETRKRKHEYEEIQRKKQFDEEQRKKQEKKKKEEEKRKSEEAYDPEKESLATYISQLQESGKTRNQVMQGLVTGERPIWEQSEEEQEKVRKALDQAYDKDGKLKPKSKDGEKKPIGATSEAADSGTAAQGGKVESEAERKGMVASAERQAEFSDPEMQAQKNLQFGTSEGSSGGGGILGTIVVKLASNLEGEVEDTRQVMIQLQNASSRK